MQDTGMYPELKPLNLVNLKVMFEYMQITFVVSQDSHLIDSGLGSCV